MASAPADGESEREPTAPISELHELEFAVMEQLWQLGRASVHDVLGMLNSGDQRQRAYTTILTVMRRLHHKGFLKRERHDRTDFYAPIISRARYAHTQVRAVVDQLVDQYGELALAHFARQVEPLSLKQLTELRKLAEDH